MDSLKASVLTAFYTPQPVVDAVSDVLKYSGVDVKRFWNRRQVRRFCWIRFCGMTNIPVPKCLPMRRDLLTGKIPLSALHPSILTRIEGFEED